QILFGAAVILIIGAALYVPWKRMEQIVQEVNLQTAEGVARQAVMEHQMRPNPPPAHAAAEGDESAEPQFVWPRLIAIPPDKSIKLDRFERQSLRDFADRSDLSHYALSYRLKKEDRYRLAMPLYNE